MDKQDHFFLQDPVARKFSFFAEQAEMLTALGQLLENLQATYDEKQLWEMQNILCGEFVLLNPETEIAPDNDDGFPSDEVYAQYIAGWPDSIFNICYCRLDRAAQSTLPEH